VEPIAQEAAPGGGQDLLATGVPVLLADLRHAAIINKTNIRLDICGRSEQTGK